MWLALTASPFVQALLANPWVKNIFIPLVAETFLKAMDRYKTDPQFAAKVDAARALKAKAITKEEKYEAARATRDALFSLHGE